MDTKKIQSLLREKGVPASEDDLIFTFLSLYEIAFKDRFDGTLEDAIEKSSMLNSKQFNVQRMQSVLLANGIRIGNDDPVFTMLGMNEIMLENMVETYQQKLKREHVQSMSMRSAKREKYVIYLTCLVIIILTFFGGRDIEWLRQSLAGIAGAAFGAAVCLFALMDRDEPAPLKNMTMAATTTQANGVWTEAEFCHAVDRVKPKLSLRTVAVCRDVLINRVEACDAAAKEKMSIGQVQRALSMLIEQKERI